MGAQRVGAVTRPGIVLGSLDDPGAHGIEFDVAIAGQELAVEHPLILRAYAGTAG